MVSYTPTERGKFVVEMGRSKVTCRESAASALKGGGPIEMPFTMVVAKESCIRWACTLLPPGKYG